MSTLQLSTFNHLIDDVLLQLIVSLPLSDMLAIRWTSKRLSRLTKERIVWCKRFSLDVLAEHLPIPGALLPLHAITADDLEWRTRRAIRLEKRWRMPARNAFPSVNLTHSENLTVRQIILLHGTNYALTILPSKIRLWHVDSSRQESNCQSRGEWIASSADFAVVRDVQRADRVAVECNNSINILAVGSEDQLTCIGHIDCAPGRLVGMYGQYLLLNTVDKCSESDDVRGIILIDWQSNSLNQYVLPWSSVYGNFISFTVFASQIVIAWDSFLATFPLPVSPADAAIIIEPSQMFRFRQRIQTPVVMSGCRSRTLPETTHVGSAATDGIDCLTIIARPAEQIYGWGRYGMYGGGMVRSLLYTADKVNGMFGLASIPLQSAGECEAISVGPSGRGVWVQNWGIRQCSPKTAITASGAVFTTVECDDYSYPLCSLSGSVSLQTVDSPICLDFDDGMGRIAVAVGSEVQVTDLV